MVVAEQGEGSRYSIRDERPEERSDDVHDEPDVADHDGAEQDQGEQTQRCADVCLEGGAGGVMGLWCFMDTEELVS